MDLVKTCAGFGHRDVYEDISHNLYCAVETAVKQGCEEFLCCGVGAFDRMFAGAVGRAKKLHPEKMLKLTLVIPYFTTELQKNREIRTLFDEIVLPEELEGVHPKSAIIKRNRWMVERSEVVIAYVQHGFGGAYGAVRYAQRQNKYILNTCSDFDCIDRHFTEE